MSLRHKNSENSIRYVFYFFFYGNQKNSYVKYSMWVSFRFGLVIVSDRRDRAIVFNFKTTINNFIRITILFKCIYIIFYLQPLITSVNIYHVFLEKFHCFFFFFLCKYVWWFFQNLIRKHRFLIFHVHLFILFR